MSEERMNERPMTTEDSRELPPLPEPELLKLPGGDGYDDAAPVKWAWFAHGYDTGMEPFFSDDQMRAYAFAASAGRSELLEALKELDSAETLVNSLSEEMPAAYFAAWDRRNDAWKAARSLIAKHTKGNGNGASAGALMCKWPPTDRGTP